MKKTILIENSINESKYVHSFIIGLLDRLKIKSAEELLPGKISINLLLSIVCCNLDIVLRPSCFFIVLVLGDSNIIR